MKRPADARGLSLVELMVSIAIGMLVAAAATALLLAYLQETTRLLKETRLTQALRSASDLVTNELRRAGHRPVEDDVPWPPAVAGGGGGAAVDPSNLPSGGDQVIYQYTQNPRDGVETFGFRLRNGAIDMLLGAGAWQAMTDKDTLTVTVFDVQPSWQDISLASYCARCRGGSPDDEATCPARQRVATYRVRIQAQLADDPRFSRTSSALARVRNGALVGRCD